MLLYAVAAISLVGDPKQEIQGQYDRWTKAYMARDADTLVGILSPDYTQLGAAKQPLTYDVLVAKLRLMKEAPPDPAKYSTVVKRVSVHGDEADVVAIETMATPTLDSKTKKKAESLHRHEYLDTWIRYDAGWRIRRSIITKESTQTRLARPR